MEIDSVMEKLALFPSSHLLFCALATGFQQILHSEFINAVSLSLIVMFSSVILCSYLMYFLVWILLSEDRIILTKFPDQNSVGSSTIICQKTKDVIITTNSGTRFLLLYLNMPVSVSVLYIWSPILPLSAFVTCPSIQVTFANVTFSSRGWYISRTSSCLHWVHSTRTLPNPSAETVIAHKSFAVCPIGFIGCILTLRDRRREWWVRMEFFCITL